MKINCLLIVLFYFLVFSCGQKREGTTKPKYELIEKSAWLLGTWENKTEDGQMSEVWERMNDSSFFGKSFFIVGADTVSAEAIMLEQVGNQLYYVPTVSNQNEGKAVRFALKAQSERSLQFENAMHDFPQMIKYQKLSSDSLIAEISGKINGKERSQQFPMQRARH